MPFIDESVVRLKAGNGGDGCMSFHRGKYVPMGGPDGGDGGKGGDVVILCDENTSDLTEFAFTPEHKAKDGQHGMGTRCYGREGKDLILKVPEGTDVYDTLSGKKVAEMLVHGRQVRLLRGGKGGLGNYHFKSSVNRTPRQITRGQKGQIGEYRLELRSIADVGLVGYPNAGKSSLINCITHAHSKVGAYPFTTLNPHLGRLETSADRRIVIADIPGLVDGASENRGLGHKFLKHIERCQLLLFVVDAAGYDGRTPKADYAALLAELKAYNPLLLDKPRMVVANKMDLVTKKLAATTFGAAKDRPEIFEVSCLTGDGIAPLKEKLTKVLKAKAAGRA